MLQLIDENQQFNDELNLTLKEKWNMADVGFQYHTVAVFGSQSTGKSTLLNHLFKTDFQVMDEKARRQTTKGIWLNKAPESSILVMDVEGTDGRERGEDQDFERKSALFSIAISEVIIVNMWETMVGLYNGANMGLLKTVFEVNLQLFGSKDSPRTLLCFVIRDFTSMTPLEALSQTIKEDLNKIWNELRKPEHLADSKLSDFFDLSFNALPHRVYAYQTFLENIEGLKKKFFDESNQEYVFKSQLHRKIPLDGVPHFAKSIWEKIISNKDLHLPTQQQLLAQFRCTEISKEVESTTDEMLKPFKQQILEGKIVDNLGIKLEDVHTKVISSYNEKASRYHQDIYLKVKKELEEKLSNMTESLQSKQVKIIQKASMDEFNNLKFSSQNLQDDYKKLKELSEKVKEMFSNKLKETFMESQKEAYESCLAEYSQELNPLFNARKEQIIKDFIHSLENEISSSLEEHCGLIFHECSSDLWQRIVSIFKKTVTDHESKVLQSLQDLELIPSTSSEISGSMKKVATEKLIKLLQNECAETSIVSKMKVCFERIFRYDKSGIPRIWTMADNIENIFETARDESDFVLEAFKKIQMEDLKDFVPSDSLNSSSSSSLITPSKFLRIKDRFLKEIEVYYMEAKRSLVTSTAKIPTWFILLTIILGWNEFMTILRNPFFFLMILLGLGTAYFLYSTGLSGPTIVVVKSTVKEIWNQTVLKADELGVPVRDYVRYIPGGENIPLPPHAAYSNTNTSKTLDSREGEESIELKPIQGTTNSKED